MNSMNYDSSAIPSSPNLTNNVEPGHQNPESSTKIKKTSKPVQSPITLGSIASDIQEFKDSQIAQIALLGSTSGLLLAILIVLIVFGVQGIRLKP